MSVIPAQRLRRCRWRCEPRRMSGRTVGPSSFETRFALLRMTDVGVTIRLDGGYVEAAMGTRAAALRRQSGQRQSPPSSGIGRR